MSAASLLPSVTFAEPEMSRTGARRWEYRTLRPVRGEKKRGRGPQAALNEHGADGWELVETIDYTGGGTKYLVFKRPAETSAGADDG